MTFTYFVLNITSEDMKLRYAILLSSSLFSGSGYDHGTAAGKGNLDVSLTWNPFDYFDYGQSYIVLGYGITDKMDIHGFYSSPVNNSDNYYLGMFYQFYDTKHIDLATAVGLRQYIKESTQHLFAPQLLYTLKPGMRFEIGGSFVRIYKVKTPKNKTNLKKTNLLDLGTTIDVAIYIPIIKKRNNGVIQEVKLGLGAFRPILWKPNHGDWYPTYSVDIKVKIKG